MAGTVCTFFPEADKSLSEEVRALIRKMRDA
jgi:hypothetical protein